MFNPNASSIENAIILFAVVAPVLGLLYLAIYFAAHVSRRRRQRRGAEPGRSLLECSAGNNRVCVEPVGMG